MSDGCESLSVKIKQMDECRDYQRGACQRGQRCKYAHVDGALKSDYRELFIDNLLAETLGGNYPKVSMLETFEGIKGRLIGRRMCADRFIHKCGKRVFSDNGKVLHEEERSKKIKLDDEANTNGPFNDCSSNSSTPTSLMSLPSQPICKDYLKGRCSRSICCKYRHMTLDEFEKETFEKAAIHVIDRLLTVMEYRYP